jgi:hypothetical protein
MNEMIERVAVRMYESDPCTHWSGDLGDKEEVLAWADARLESAIREQVRGYARVAIEAMREPTAAMIEASRLCTIRNSRAADPARPFESPFTAMIDEALK